MRHATVAILRTNPAQVLEDQVRLFELTEGPESHDRSATTILKDNIRWRYPFPSANTTPRRHAGEGTLAPRAA